MAFGVANVPVKLVRRTSYLMPASQNRQEMLHILGHIRITVTYYQGVKVNRAYT